MSPSPGDTTERTLVLLRHGKSDWGHDVIDEERPLAKRGRRQVIEAAEWLARVFPAIDLAVVSPAERTQQTVAAVLTHGPPLRALRHEPALYTDSGADVMAVVATTSEEVESLLVVGHEPTLSELVQLLGGVDLRVRTSEVVVLRWHGEWATGVGRARVVAAGRPPRHDTLADGANLWQDHRTP